MHFNLSTMPQVIPQIKAKFRWLGKIVRLLLTFSLTSSTVALFAMLWSCGVHSANEMFSGKMLVAHVTTAP